MLRQMWTDTPFLPSLSLSGPEQGGRQGHEGASLGGAEVTGREAASLPGPCSGHPQDSIPPCPAQGPAGIHRPLAGRPPTVLSPQSGTQTSPSSPIREGRGLRAADPSLLASLLGPLPCPPRAPSILGQLELEG